MTSETGAGTEPSGGEPFVGLRIGTNIPALVALRHLGRATESVNKSMERLATGRRIVRSSDDPAGFAIAERMEARLRSLTAARRNAEDGISMAQIAEGALSEIDEALVRARELAVQAGNGTLSASDRASLDAEFQSLRDLVGQIAASTTFNGIDLLSGLTGSVTLQVGAGTRAGIDTLDVSLATATPGGLGLAGLSILTAADASTAMGVLDAAIDTVAGQRASFGATQNALQFRISGLQTEEENLAAARSRIVDVDVARETAELVRAQILQQSALSVLAIANRQPELALRLLDAVPR